jgi:hypothetical protein
VENSRNCSASFGEVFWGKALRWIVLCRVFISHSEKDNKFVEYVHSACFLLDVECLVAEYRQQAGTELWDKVQSMIEKSYVVIPILTISGVESEWVQKEITMAKTLGKKFIPIVQAVVKENIPDVLKGKEYIPYNDSDTTETVMRIALQLKEMKRNDIGFATNC